MTDNEIKQFVSLVVEMRKTQKQFFKNRNYSILEKSKKLENEVDERATEILKSFEALESQMDLFEGANE